MSGEFLDTNILVYAHDSTARKKQEIAADLLLRLSAEHAGLLSTQVLMEFFVTVTRKIPKPLNLDTAMEIVADFGTWPTFAPKVEDVLHAIRIVNSYSIGFWDALIIRAATAMGASVIWSEDLTDGKRYEGIPVRNPFKAA